MKLGAWRRGIVLVSCALFAMSGCVRRTIAISSSPADALVFVNDREIGRTPCEVSFTYYGEYDVRLKLDGYESVAGSGTASAPFWDFIGADLVAELAPLNLESRVEWHFDLVKAQRSPTALLERARSMRGIVEGAMPSAVAEVGPVEPVGEGALPPKGSAEVPVPPTEAPSDYPGSAP